MSFVYTVVKSQTFLNRKSVLDPESIRSLNIAVQIVTAVTSISIGLGSNSGPVPHRLHDIIIDLSLHTKFLDQNVCSAYAQAIRLFRTICVYVFLVNFVHIVISLISVDSCFLPNIFRAFIAFYFQCCMFFGFLNRKVESFH